MNRIEYFETLKSIPSPLAAFSDDLPVLIKAALEGNLGTLKYFAEKMAANADTAASTRAALIRLQCTGYNTDDMFEEYREIWGIPIFEDGLVAVDDFKHGFLHTFRDHTSSWDENEEAREWFFTHVEARFVQRYEYWSCDDGENRMLLSEVGDYKSILWSMIHKHADYTPFVSPVFTKSELTRFYTEYNEEEYEFEKSLLLGILAQNPNW